jgi:hypothetical protein
VLVVTSGDEGAGLPDERDYDADDRGFHLGSSASDAAANKDGKRKTAWRYEAGQGYATGHEVDAPDDEDINEGGKNKQGGRKTTHWVHRTKITCLRLIQRMNPWAAKDSGLMWQQIADQIHEETANVVERDARGKLKNCQVHSDGTALNMWYRRQLEKMEEAFDVGEERTKSGQGGMSKKAAAKRAEKTDTDQDEIEQEWEVLRSLKALQEDASRAAIMKKQKVQTLKDIKNQQLPDEVKKVACEDQQVRMAAIVELERRMKKCDQEAKTLTKAGRCAVMTEQQKEEQKLLAELKQIQRDKRKSEGGNSSDDAEDTQTGGGGTSDAKGRGRNNNLKLSFDAMTQKITDLSEVMRQDVEQDRPMSLDQVKTLLVDLDEDIKNGLRLEGEERRQVRMMFLKDYARSKRSSLGKPE